MLLCWDLHIDLQMKMASPERRLAGCFTLLLGAKAGWLMTRFGRRKSTGLARTCSYACRAFWVDILPQRCWLFGRRWGG